MSKKLPNWLALGRPLLKPEPGLGLLNPLLPLGRKEVVEPGLKVLPPGRVPLPNDGREVGREAELLGRVEGRGLPVLGRLTLGREVGRELGRLMLGRELGRLIEGA